MRTQAISPEEKGANQWCLTSPGFPSNSHYLYYSDGPARTDSGLRMQHAIADWAMDQISIAFGPPWCPITRLIENTLQRTSHYFAALQVEVH